jgi:hypothetical protein
MSKLLLVAVLVLSVLACDGPGDSTLMGDAGVGGAGGGLLRSDAGFISCPIPEPTASQVAPSGSAPTFLVVTNDVSNACIKFKTANPLISTLTSSQLTVPTAGIDCSDVAHDFKGSTDIVWCVSVVAPDGVSPCNGGPTGSPTCLATGVGIMATTTNYLHGSYLNHNWGVCSSSGVFMGWACY